MTLKEKLAAKKKRQPVGITAQQAVENIATSMTKDVQQTQSIEKTKPEDVLTKIQSMRSVLRHNFINRREEIDGLLVALLAKENVVYLGEPGTAKSDMVRAFAGVFQREVFFDMLLTKFSEPSEVFGPKNLKAFMEGRSEILTEGFLPKATVAFLDECFKANSAILNSLLTILNEKMFKTNQAQGFESVPLEICIGASNELPPDETRALWDRFVLRFWITELEATVDLQDLISIGVNNSNPKGCLNQLKLNGADLQGLHELQEKIKNVEFSQQMSDLLLRVILALVDKQHSNPNQAIRLRPSDRMIVKWVRLIRAYAMLNGRDHVQATDFAIVKNCWNRPEEHDPLAEVLGEVCYPLQSDVQKILDMAKISYEQTVTVMDTQRAGYSKESAITACAKTQGDLEDQVKELENLGKAYPGNESLIDDAFEELNKYAKSLTNKLQTENRGLSRGRYRVGS